MPKCTQLGAECCKDIPQGKKYFLCFCTIIVVMWIYEFVGWETIQGVENSGEFPYWNMLWSPKQYQDINICHNQYKLQLMWRLVHVRGKVPRSWNRTKPFLCLHEGICFTNRSKTNVLLCMCLRGLVAGIIGFVLWLVYFHIVAG